MSRMRKFVILHKENIILQEVECVEQFSFPWEVNCKEKKYLILSPTVMKHQVFMHWAIFNSEGDAFIKANFELREEFENLAKANKTSFDEEKFVASINNIEVKRL